MKIYALPRVDGGVEIMQVYSGTVEEAIAKWHPKRRADITGEFSEISADDIPKDRSTRKAWRADLSIDESKLSK